MSKTENIKSPKEKKPKHKDMLGKISKSSLKISKISWQKSKENKLNGFIEITINLSDLGFDKMDSYIKFNKELFSNFMIDFMGELIIRNNMNKFVKDFLNQNKEEYSSLVSLEKHLHFGVRLEPEDKIVYIFHCSLLQNLLTEEFKSNTSFL
jgi:hypothetical protein